MFGNGFAQKSLRKQMPALRLAFGDDGPRQPRREEPPGAREAALPV
jgi:hypothetical protein